jgi:hypothetical protein
VFSKINVIRTVRRLLCLSPSRLLEIWDWSPLVTLFSDASLEVRIEAVHAVGIILSLSEHEINSMIGLLQEDSIENMDDSKLVDDENESDLERAKLFISGLVDYSVLPSFNSASSEMNVTYAQSESGQESDKLNTINKNIASLFLGTELVNHSCTSNKEFVHTMTTCTNLEGMAIALCQKRPILVEGPSGSGKTALIEYVATLTGNSNSMIRVHLDDQMDSKTLVGSYVCTETPGEFVWQAGALTQAMEQVGHPHRPATPPPLPTPVRPAVLLLRRGEGRTTASCSDPASRWHPFNSRREREREKGRRYLFNWLGQAPIRYRTTAARAGSNSIAEQHVRRGAALPQHGAARQGTARGGGACAPPWGCSSHGCRFSPWLQQPHGRAGSHGAAKHARAGCSSGRSTAREWIGAARPWRAAEDGDAGIDRPSCDPRMVMRSGIHSPCTLVVEEEGSMVSGAALPWAQGWMVNRCGWCGAGAVDRDRGPRPCAPRGAPHTHPALLRPCWLPSRVPRHRGCPRASCPRASCPRASCPRASCPRASCPRAVPPSVVPPALVPPARLRTLPVQRQHARRRGAAQALAALVPLLERG